jgi:hypothetical protein
MKKKVSLRRRFSCRFWAWGFFMKKHLITWIVTASAFGHSHAADLTSQLDGSWKPAMEKTLVLPKKANREMNPTTQTMIGRMLTRTK